jgi:NUDIX domain.
MTLPVLPRCCGTSVGVIITAPDGRLLMITRGWYPTGIAPVAGHVADAHTDAVSALSAEVSEEVGLTVTGEPTLLWAGWLPNLCQSLPATPVPGHHWWLYRATATGTLRPAAGETRGAAWYTQAEVAQLAARTLDYARGKISEAEWKISPGLEPVWCHLLTTAGLLDLTGAEVAHVRRLYTTPPTEYWITDRLVPATTVVETLTSAMVAATPAPDQARMLAAAATLAERGYRAGLPALAWRADRLPPLVGRVTGYGMTSEEVRAALTGWAALVGAPVRETESVRGGAVRLRAATEVIHQGMPVPVALTAYVPED